MRAVLCLGLMILAAAGGYVQVATQPVFWCGRVEAFPNTLILSALALVQTGIYLAAQASAKWQRIHVWSQGLILPLLAFALGQVMLPYPGAITLFAGLAALAMVAGLRGPAAGLFMVSALGFLAAFGQIAFSLPGAIVRPWHIGLALVGALACARWIAATVPPLRFRLGTLLPLSLLLFPVLRARMPDVAYDSLSYKTTIPYQMADWMTGDTAIIDGYMVGTNLQEMLNTLLIVITRDWLPALISLTSYILLALILPLAFRAEPAPVTPRGEIEHFQPDWKCSIPLFASRFTRLTGTASGSSQARSALDPSSCKTWPDGSIIRAFAGLCAFVLTEAGIAQGTAYQEPLMLLFLAAAIIPTPGWPAFLAMAVAVKINAAFIAPVIVLYHVRFYRRFWRAPRLIMAGTLAATVVIAPQLGRNVIQSGRLLGMSETLATLTDPPGPHRVMTSGETRYDQPVRGGVLHNALAAACNIWLLDGLCSVRYQGATEAGFNVFPASRAWLWAGAFLFAACLPGRDSDGAPTGRPFSSSRPPFWPSLPLLSRRKAVDGRHNAGHEGAGHDGASQAGRRWVFLSACVFAACCAGFLSFLSEDRYFLPLSFGFPLLLLMHGDAAAALVRPLSRTPRLAIGLGCFLIGSDLIPGAFTNTSWICARDVLTPVQHAPLRGPQTQLQTFLAARVTQYKQACPPPGLPPIILAEDDRMNSPYLGTQRIFHVFTQAMLHRFLGANPARQASAAGAILAVVAGQTSTYPETILGPGLAEFQPCFEGDGLRVLCSMELAPAGSSCARSLY